MSEETLYFSRDFEWEELRDEIEQDVSLRDFFLPFDAHHPTSTSSDVEPWQCFYKRHSTGRFFKERRYILKEFPELQGAGDFSRVLEVGCGNGSTVIPILRGNKRITVYACDCSEVALERARQVVDTADGISAVHRFHLFFCDFSSNGFPNWLIYDSSQNAKPYDLLSDVEQCKETGRNKLLFLEHTLNCIGGVDFVTLIFTLSAVPLQRMPFVISQCFTVLKPGGMLFFRDYGLYDMTMLRFLPTQRVGDREYVRSDGTRSYFFSLDIVRELFLSAGFIEVELEYCCVKLVNHRNGKIMRRVWVHGKFQKSI